METAVCTCNSVRYSVDVRYWECPLKESALYNIIIIILTRNELASLAHSFYTSLKHQLMLASIIVLLSSTLDYVACMMLDPRL